MDDKPYIGIDEVGRGPWAGPLVAVAAYGRDSDLPTGVTDSKQLSKKRRDSLHRDIVSSVRVGIGWSSPDEIDANGLSEATASAIEAALLSLGKTGPIFLDGNVNYLEGVEVSLSPKGDQNYPLIGAASIVAKQLRDRYMAYLDISYPAYGFAQHVGYGTKTHQAALADYGVTPYHRRSFKPIAQYIDQAEGG